MINTLENLFNGLYFLTGSVLMVLALGIMGGIALHIYNTRNDEHE